MLFKGELDAVVRPNSCAFFSYTVKFAPFANDATCIMAIIAFRSFTIGWGLFDTLSYRTIQFLSVELPFVLLKFIVCIFEEF